MRFRFESSKRYVPALLLPNFLGIGYVLLDGVLPEVRTPNPLTIVAGQMSENSSQRLESGGQQMVIPTGVSVTIEGKSRSNAATPTISSSGLIQVANGDGLEVTASCLKPGNRAGNSIDS